MTEIRNSKQYDLEERTLKFAKEAIKFVKSLPIKKILSCGLRFAEKKLKKAGIG